MQQQQLQQQQQQIWQQHEQEQQLQHQQQQQRLAQHPLQMDLAFHQGFSPAPLVAAQLGSLAMETIGSAGHQWGDCKPCAFLHIRGCGAGADCDFCHLCPPGEKKRRAKEKKLLMREARHAAAGPCLDDAFNGLPDSP
jgi:hypothetical protein